MSYSKLFLFVPLLLLLQANAQQVEWGSQQKVKQKSLYTQIIGEADGNIFLLRSKDQTFSSDLQIERYKSNLNLDLSMELPMAVNGQVERVLLMDKQLFVFISARNTLTRNIDILVQKFDQNIKALNTVQVLCSINEKQFIDKRSIQIKTTADKSKFGMMYISKNADDKGVLNLYCFDPQLTQQYGKQFNLNAMEKDLFITSFDVSNSGDAFLLIDYPQLENKGSADLRSFFLYAYYQNQDHILEYNLKQDESMFIEELGMAVNNFNQSICVTGFYSETGSKKIHGYFFSRFNMTTHQMDQQTKGGFGSELVGKLSSSHIEHGEPDLRDFFIRKLIPRSDGGLMIVAEKYYQTKQVYTTYVNNFPQTTTRVVYNYDEAATICLNPDGMIQFTDVIKKHQSTMSDGGYYSSIATIPTQDNVYLIYNNDNGDQTDVAMHSLNYDGHSDTKILVKALNFNASIIPSEYKLVAANAAIVAAIRDKRFTLIRLTF